MIFKTIDDDSTISSQRIVNIFNARKIAQQQATAQLEIDIACLKKYEIACQNGTVSTTQFDNIMEKSSVTAKQYATNIQNGTGSAKAYAQAQKANNVALQSVGTEAGIASKAVKLLSGTMNTIASFAGAPAEAYKYLEDNAQDELDDVFAKIKAKINLFTTLLF